MQFIIDYSESYDHAHSTGEALSWLIILICIKLSYIIVHFVFFFFFFRVKELVEPVEPDQVWFGFDLICLPDIIYLLYIYFCEPSYFCYFGLCMKKKDETFLSHILWDFSFLLLFVANYLFCFCFLLLFC